MFSKSVIGSARFLRMPATSRLLYYDLGMDADDVGVVEAFSVMRKTGATEDDLRVLASKGFVRVMNEDLVSYILDWNTNNQIRKDRYHESVYKSLIDGSCNVILESGNQMATNGLPGDNQMATEVRLGKDSIGKGSIERADKPPTRHKFSPPTVNEVKTYCQEQGYYFHGKNASGTCGDRRGNRQSDYRNGRGKCVRYQPGHKPKLPLAEYGDCLTGWGVNSMNDKFSRQKPAKSGRRWGIGP